MEFIAKSPKTQKILNTLRVSANLPVNILIHGERGVGKKTLVESVFRDIPTLSVDEVDQIQDAEKIYIYDLHHCTNLRALMQKLGTTRVIATSNDYKEAYEEFFSVFLHIPPLKERPEDLEALIEYYIKQVQRDFDVDLDPAQIEVDLSKNAISLKKSICTEAVFRSLSEEHLMQLMEGFLAPRLEDGYKDLLYLFEVPLLRAAKKRYKSNLAISKALRLNRATVTSKMQRYEKLIR